MAAHEGPSNGTAGGLLTQKEYAKRKGWSKQYVNQLVKKGRISLQGDRINPALADAALAKDRDPAQDRAYKLPAPDSGTPAQASSQAASHAHQGSFSKARAVREHYRALREKMEYEQQAGNLVSASVVTAACFGAAREFRDSIRMGAIDIGHMLASKYGLNDREVVEVTTAAVDKTLTEFSDRFLERSQAYKKSGSSESED